MNYSYLKYLLDQTIIDLRKQDCLGCIHNELSQIHHFVCMTVFNEKYYRNRAIDLLFKNDEINEDEERFLRNNFYLYDSE